jgi:putative ABC transport system substrate-binding protein
MRRRQFIAVLGGIAAVWPVSTDAQQPPTPVIGLLQSGAPGYDLAGFREGLKEAGYVEGRNLAVEYRWANRDLDRLPVLAADLVQHKVRVIAALASVRAARAAKAATSTIPIVFGFGANPMELGLVASFNRPGANVTGTTSMANELVGKQIGLMHELLPRADNIGMLTNSRSPIRDFLVKDAQAAAAAVGLTIDFLEVSNASDIGPVFDRLADQRRVQALLVANDPLFITERVQLANLAARYAVPVIYPFRKHVEAGGLMSYGANLSDRDRVVGQYVGRILNGEKPADLPVQQSSKFELVINLKTAKMLGLTFPNSMQLLADEVIE